MNFDKAAYKAAKEHVNGLIKDSHDWENTEGFIADGVVCPDLYEQQSLRILCILGESYGWDEEGMTDIEQQPERDIIGVGEPRRWTAKRLPALLWLLHSSAERGFKLAWEEFPSLLSITPENTRLLQSALARSAWINVKKASRHIGESDKEGTRMSYFEAYTHALKNAEILRTQIASIAPTLIIICGQAVFNSLHDAGLLGHDVVHGKKGEVQSFGNSVKLIEVSHPGHHADWGYEGIFQNFEVIQSALL